MTRRRTLGWAAVVALVVLTGRALVYGLSPSPLASASRLGGAVGGPRPVFVALVAISLAAVISSALVWIAAGGVRERWALGEPRSRGAAPRLAVARVGVRALGLWAASCLVFSLAESYVHWRAGLGFHGLHCLLGPVHENALPVLAALSLVAAAAVTAGGHVLGWMRRALGGLCGRPRSSAGRRPVLAPLLEALELPGELVGGLGARGPPLSCG